MMFKMWLLFFCKTLECLQHCCLSRSSSLESHSISTETMRHTGNWSTKTPSLPQISITPYYEQHWVTQIDPLFALLFSRFTQQKHSEWLKNICRKTQAVELRSYINLKAYLGTKESPPLNVVGSNSKIDEISFPSGTDTRVYMTLSWAFRKRARKISCSESS